MKDKKLEKKEAKKYRHSTTVYLPRKDNECYVRAITAVSRLLFGVSDTLGKNSKYIIMLVRKDLRERGVINSSSGEFDLDKITSLEKEVKEAAEKVSF